MRTRLDPLIVQYWAARYGMTEYTIREVLRRYCKMHNLRAVGRQEAGRAIAILRPAWKRGRRP